ncbi:hypothetical protein [Hymenobacter elongatus]|uniref:Uncharacterized protein n=1 Tax=Hymenobacter elongatus TaxID=877208 RepID=A0A4Z0PPI4_9BACT|nr:hypothetical protein [Hymenobacter elongatus]TGE16619.1 hypothetical protein E5J99_09590 [Hymenobacter elongatus]
MDSKELVLFAKQFNVVALLTYLLPLGIGLHRWRSLLPAYQPLFWFIVLPGCLLNGALAEFGRHVLHNNILFLELATLSETLFLSWAYYNSFHSAQSRQILRAALGLFLATYIFESLYLNGGFSTSQIIYTHVAQSILLVGVAVAYFEQTLRELRNIDLGQDSMFMVSVGSILYYAGTLMVFVLEGQLQGQPDLIWIMYIIQFVLLIVFNLFLSIALWNGHRPIEHVAFPEGWPLLRK